MTPAGSVRAPSATRRSASPGLVGVLCLAVACIAFGGEAAMSAPAAHGQASYYTVASAIQEGTCTTPATRDCRMANGRPLDDTAYTAASWDYPFGTTVTVCHAFTRKCVDAVIADRGPSRTLYRQGRIIDLSRQAFATISPLTKGIIPVTVEFKQ